MIYSLSRLRKQPQNDDDLKNEDDLENEDEHRNKDNLKNDDESRSTDDLWNEDDLKNEQNFKNEENTFYLWSFHAVFLISVMIMNLQNIWQNIFLGKEIHKTSNAIPCACYAKNDSFERDNNKTWTEKWSESYTCK